MYKSNNQFQRPSGQVGHPRSYAQTMPSRRGDIPHRPVHLNEQAMFGSVLTGMGPAVGNNLPLHPALQPPQPVPKFPVERERIIPIQVNCHVKTI